MPAPRRSIRRDRSALTSRARTQKLHADMSRGGGRPFVRSATPGASPNIASAPIFGRTQEVHGEMAGGGGRAFVGRGTPGASPNIASARIFGRNLRVFTIVQVLLSPRAPRTSRNACMKATLTAANTVTPSDLQRSVS